MCSRRSTRLRPRWCSPVEHESQKLSQQDLRALGATPGLVIRRISPDGDASIEELVTEVRGGKSRRQFITRLEKKEAT